MPYVKMQQILEANTTIGRKKMSFEAGVSEDIARRFLEESRHLSILSILSVVEKDYRA